MCSKSTLHVAWQLSSSCPLNCMYSHSDQQDNESNRRIFIINFQVDSEAGADNLVTIAQGQGVFESP